MEGMTIHQGKMEGLVDVVLIAEDERRLAAMAEAAGKTVEQLVEEMNKSNEAGPPANDEGKVDPVLPDPTPIAKKAKK
jgi:hypothetical protein